METSLTTSVGILGWGRFGRLLGTLLEQRFQLRVFDRRPPDDDRAVSLEDVLREQTLFLCVPIREFKPLIKTIAPRLRPGTTVIDVCSVKVYPVTVMREHLPESVDIIATHPLFGPDSWQIPTEHRMVMYPVRDRAQTYDHWRSFFTDQQIKVLEMEPEQHDRLAARTQGITHFVGRVLREARIDSTPIDTLGFQDLLHVVEQTCNDSWELFLDLQNFNPYTMSMIQTMEASIQTIRERIIQRE
ncbi:MAG: prephenate dehydrogenase/arogenate dehydrogenase family protein [Candidatus Neomarinimicrobiota bacterium]|nr:MAG: prephenate dehydrogenase/arogenate dehydrogenase family protein [Candidatus Neomarinimicrobiota bacterium]